MKPIQWLFGLLGLTLAILPWQAFAQSFVSDNELRTDILEVDKKSRSFSDASRPCKASTIACRLN